jgi:nicotinamide-nucleotide amidase
MPEVNRRQAEVIDGARLLPNPRGTAPGQWIEADERVVILLPGVPGELVPMVQSQLEPWLAAHGDGRGREERTLRVACLPESAVEARIAPLYERFGRETVSLLASPGEVLVRAYADGAPERRREHLDTVEQAVRERLGDAVFATGTTPLEEVVGKALERRAETVATAESCTGGLLAERLTRIPGSSAWMLGAVVAYADAVKRELLGVDPGILERHGAVSRPVAEALAQGARQRLAASWGIGITGIAGPGGGTPEKPVGTVHLALAGPADTEAWQRRLRLPGDRLTVRLLAAQWALDALRRALSGLPQMTREAASPEYSG